jgi:hypothetical protein
MCMRGEMCTSKLCVALFHIAQPLCEELDGDILIVLQQMPLRRRPCVVDEGVSIGCDTSHTTNNVPMPNNQYPHQICEKGRTS